MYISLNDLTRSCSGIFDGEITNELKYYKNP